MIDFTLDVTEAATHWQPFPPPPKGTSSQLEEGQCQLPPQMVCSQSQFCSPAVCLLLNEADGHFVKGPHADLAKAREQQGPSCNTSSSKERPVSLQSVPAPCPQGAPQSPSVWFGVLLESGWLPPSRLLGAHLHRQHRILYAEAQLPAPNP